MVKFRLLPLLISAFFCSSAFAQDTIRPLYSLTIRKYVNNENVLVDKFIGVDSSGNIYKGRSKTSQRIDIKNLSKEINVYIKEEHVLRYPGSDDIIIIEAPHPQLNEQWILVEVQFLDDHYKESGLRNKTYYSWGKAYDNKVNDYPLLKYLAKTEVQIIQALLQ